MKKWKLHGNAKSIKKNKNCHHLIAAYKVTLHWHYDVPTHFLLRLNINTVLGKLEPQFPVP